MFSRDALEMRDYEAEDFQKKRSGPLQAVGDDLLDRGDVMGVADKHWNDKYGDFFDQGEDEDKQNVVVIPRYQGPQNTRVDVIPLISNQFDVSGIPNHSQSSCVYLKQSFKFAVSSRNINLGLQNNYLTRPFTIQRQFQKLYWTAPQCARQLDTNIRQQVRLAPYLCDAQKLANCTNYQVTAQLVTNVAPAKWFFNYTLFEPLLGFQSGYKLLDGSRPYNQNVMKYPLAIQDYQLNIQKYAKISDTVKRCLRDSRCVNASKVENYQDTFVQAPAAADTQGTTRANTYVGCFFDS